MIGGKGVAHARHGLVFGIPDRLFILIRRIGKIFRLPDQESQPLRGTRTANIIAKFVPIAVLLFHMDQDQVIQGGSPPNASFRDVGGAIDVHAELPHDLSTQFALGLRSVNQQHSLLFVSTGKGRGKR
jgi:hypothetical protein